MATAGVYHEPPTPSLHTKPSPSPSPHQTSPAPTMSSTPATSTSSIHKPAFTPAQLEAQTILTHLLTRLSQPNPSADVHQPHNQYTAWINQHSIPTLIHSLYSLIRPQVWHLLSMRLSLDALKSLGGDVRHEGRAIYLNGILGVDKCLRIYVGQSACLRQRVAQHLNFRYRRDHPSLHYYALEWSVYNVFGVLALVPLREGGGGLAGVDRMDLVMNMLEMWMCLVFRCLPGDTLDAWLPDDALVGKRRLTAKEGVVGGLNVASPLDQGVDVKDMHFVDLSGEEDGVVQDWLKQVRRRKGGEEAVEKVKVDSQDGVVEVDEKELARRKKTYAEKARRYQRRRDTDIVVPQWVFLGALAVGVGVLLFRSSGGPGGRGAWR